MASYSQRRDIKRNLSPDVASVSSSACLAILHFSCWTASVVLGAVAVWLRLQATAGVDQSIFGITGVGLWGTLAYLVTGFLGIRASKLQTTRAVKWYFRLSVISLLSSIGILAFSSLVVAMEASIEAEHKRLVVAATLCGFSLLEVITSLVSCISCYSTIGCCNEGVKEAGRFKDSNTIPKFGKVGPWAEDCNHVAVMALPARQAAELFYTMYRPYFPNVGPGFNSGNVSSQPASMNAEPYDYVSPDDFKRRHRRAKRHVRDEQRYYDEGFLADEGLNLENELSDEDEVKPPTKKTAQRQGTPYGHATEDHGMSTPLPPPGLYSQSRLEPVPEQVAPPKQQSGDGDEDEQDKSASGKKETNSEKNRLPGKEPDQTATEKVHSDEKSPKSKSDSKNPKGS